MRNQPYLWIGTRCERKAMKKTNKAEFAHYREVVPYWLAALSVAVCQAHGTPPTLAAIDSVMVESYEAAMRCFTADLRATGRLAKGTAKWAVRDRAADEAGKGGGA